MVGTSNLGSWDGQWLNIEHNWTYCSITASFIVLSFQQYFFGYKVGPPNEFPKLVSYNCIHGGF